MTAHFTGGSRGGLGEGQGPGWQGCRQGGGQSHAVLGCTHPRQRREGGRIPRHPPHRFPKCPLLLGHLHVPGEETGASRHLPGQARRAWQRHAGLRGPRASALPVTDGRLGARPPRASPGLSWAPSAAAARASRNAPGRRTARRSLCTLYLQEEACEQISRVTRENVWLPWVGIGAICSQVLGKQWSSRWRAPSRPTQGCCWHPRLCVPGQGCAPSGPLDLHL